MILSPPESWKILAWNGVSLRVPHHWEVNLLDKSYLQLDDGMGPVMEMKWQQLRGRFSHRAHLRKLVKSSSVASNLSFHQRPLPEKWHQVLGNFETLSFEWHGTKIAGEGAIIYCNSCQKATLIQFYRKTSRDDPQVPVGVLSSLRDHSEDGRVEWAVFGLRALVPERFDLLEHRFHPGHYQLLFQARHERVHLRRWGPAGILLAGGDLRDWFQKNCKDSRWCNPSSFKKIDYGGNPAVQGQSQRSDSFAARLRARMTRKLPHCWIRIWHLRDHNQILSVEARGLRPVDAPLLEEICYNYEVV
jgi:hypothetical protein